MISLNLRAAYVSDGDAPFQEAWSMSRAPEINTQQVFKGMYNIFHACMCVM